MDDWSEVVEIAKENPERYEILLEIGRAYMALSQPERKQVASQFNNFEITSTVDRSAP